MLNVSKSGHLSKVLERCARARGPIVLLVAAGVLFAAGSRRLTIAYSPDLALYERLRGRGSCIATVPFAAQGVSRASSGVFLPPLAIPLSYALGFSLVAGAGGIALVLSSDGLTQYPGWPRRTCYYLLLGTVAIVSLVTTFSRRWRLCWQ